MGLVQRPYKREFSLFLSTLTLILVAEKAYPTCPGAQLNLSFTSCQDRGDEFVATVTMTNVPIRVAGGQFFIEYSEADLEVVSIEAGDKPFDVLLFGNACIPEIEHCTPGRIEMAVGIIPGTQGTRNDTIIGRIRFRVISDSRIPFVRFIRTNFIPSRLSTDTGIPISVNLIDVESFWVDVHDYSDFQSCFSGDGVDAFDDCRCSFDLDEDMDVDLEDFEAYFAILNGPQAQVCEP